MGWVESDYFHLTFPLKAHKACAFSLFLFLYVCVAYGGRPRLMGGV